MSISEIFAYLGALLIGLVMGMIGSGGSILSVPIYTYLFGMPTLEATTYSLFVVGTTSLIGTIPYLKKRQIELNHILYFGLSSVIAVISIRALILPNLPNVLLTTDYFVVKKDPFFLVIFALLMGFSAYKMIKKKRLSGKTNPQHSKELLIIQGIGIGTLTGFIGAGGGFLIIPALVIILGLDMRKAIGTSLCIITLNSLLGFASSVKHVEIHWGQLLFFTSLSIIGIILGNTFSKKINNEKLKPMFGWFLITIGSYIIIKELILQ